LKLNGTSTYRLSWWR